MAHASVDRIRDAIADPAALVSDVPLARAAQLLRTYLLEQIAIALRDCPAPAMLVKGAALSVSVYPHAWQRPMADVDVMVARDDVSLVSAALEAAGIARSVDSGRTRSLRFLEVQHLARFAGTDLLVEIHHTLDKISPRPIDHAAIVRRAHAHPCHPRFLIPEHTDHALLVIIHAAAAEFRHPVAWVDLARLFEAGVDEAALVARAREWHLGTAVWVALSTLASLGYEVPRVIDALSPSALRRRLLAKWGYRPGEYPVADFASQPGARWFLRQAPLRDDPVGWLGGVGRYAGARILDRTS